MATDLALVLAHLTSFYDFGRKVVVHAGAGGGQLIGYARASRKVLAVDPDPAAIQRLERRIAQEGLQEIVSALPGDFRDLDLHGDVVLLEFCLHELADPLAAIGAARAIAPDVVVIDHLTGSRWSWYANEAEAVAAAWDAVGRAGTRGRRSFEGLQRFRSYEELRARFSAMGQESQRRILDLQGRTDIAIPMPYGVALL